MFRPSVTEKVRGGLSRHLQSREGYLAFDVGTRKIGIAFGQRVTGSAQALARLPAHHGVPADWNALDRLVREWRPEAFVVGLPRQADGREGYVARQARRFGAQLSARYSRPVHYVDERLTSAEAVHRLASSGAPRRRRERDRDAMAAAVILESFLEGQHADPASG